MVQGGFDQYGNINGSDASRRADFARQYQQYEQQLGGMGGKGGQQVGLGQAGLSPQQANNIGQQLVRGQQPQGGMGGKGGSQSSLPQYAQPYFARMLRGAAMRQQSGLAALAQPTATTQAATPAPEQPYMGNYLS
jgi:hypothetical protein